MGLMDRDYMRAGAPANRRVTVAGRLRFALWRLINQVRELFR